MVGFSFKHAFVTAVVTFVNIQGILGNNGADWTCKEVTEPFGPKGIHMKGRVTEELGKGGVRKQIYTFNDYDDSLEVYVDFIKGTGVQLAFQLYGSKFRRYEVIYDHQFVKRYVQPEGETTNCAVSSDGNNWDVTAIKAFE